MIGEIIKFANLIQTGGNAPLTKRTASRKSNEQPIIILETEGDDTNLRLKGMPVVLEDKQKIEAYIGTVPDLASELEFENSADGFARWIRKQIRLRSNNKCLGSTAGLLNSVPFAFVLSQTNLGNYENKAGKMGDPPAGWKTYPQIQKNLTEKLKELYLKSWADEVQREMLEKNEGGLIFALLPVTVSGHSRSDIYRSFCSDREGEPENEENLSEKKCRARYAKRLRD